MRNNLLVPNPIVIKAEASQQSIALQKVKQQFKTEEEYIYYLTHKVNNVVHEDGRIYMQLDENGNLFANSVSPYSEEFWKNIEPKIKPLIESLTNKRYLTYSSCQGHGPSFRRYVGLAFVDQLSRQYVADFVNNLKLPGVKINLLDSVCNQNISTTFKENVKYSSKYNPQEKEQKEGEIKSFNVQFHRSYDEYFFLELIVLDKVDFNLNFLKNPLKNFWLIYMKKFHWEKITQKLTDAFNSEEFKKYKF